MSHKLSKFFCCFPSKLKQSTLETLMVSRMSTTHSSSLAYPKK